MMAQRLLLLLLLLISSNLLADNPLTIIKLKSALPDQVVPTIRAMLDPGDKLTAAQNTLFIRTSPARLAEIRGMLAQLDRPARRLLITVRRGDFNRINGDRLSAGARLQSGNNSVIIGNPPRGRGSEIRINRGSINSSSRGDQRIQALEGQPAFIYSGTSMAVPERTTIIRNGTVIRQRTTSYRDALQGFHVVPNINGNRVTLSIHQQHDQPGIKGSINLQHADSVVSGQLGEWISLGGGHNRNSNQRSGISGYSNYQSGSSLNLQVMVTELP